MPLTTQQRAALNGNVQYLITWVDLRGEEQHKWFDEAELEPAAGAST